MKKWNVIFSEFDMADESLFMDTVLFDTLEEAQDCVEKKVETFTEVAKSPYKEDDHLHGRDFDVEIRKVETTGNVNNPVRTVEIKRVTDVLGECYHANIMLEELTI